MERLDWENSTCIRLQTIHHPFGQPFYIHENDVEIKVVKRRKIRQVRVHHGVHSAFARDASSPCAIDDSLAEIQAGTAGLHSMTCHNCRRRIDVSSRQKSSEE